MKRLPISGSFPAPWAGRIAPSALASVALLLAAISAAPGSAQAQTGLSAGIDTVAGRFDMGKMWTFENPPTRYFTESYGFQADEEWFETARQAALRIPGCSAAFVSPHGLVVTNHHCVRGAVVGATREGESLLDDGFYAASIQDERPLANFYVDQLIAAEDVSDEVLAALDAATTDARREEAREAVYARIQDRIGSRFTGGEGTVRVEITPLYNGGRYSAYAFRRFTDVRLVAAVELAVGHFGGDPDNFTYPRYALDFAFLRVYGRDGEPLSTDHYFAWGRDGVEEGDVVFVIGNPGPTNRLNTVAQLRFQRDYLVPAQKSFYTTRLGAMGEFYRANPEEGEALSLRTQMLSLSNSLKAYTGRLEALRDPVIMTRKANGERLFQESLAADPQLRERWGSLMDDMARVQEEKLALGPEYAAFVRFGPGNTESALLSRAFLAAQLVAAAQVGAPAEAVASVRSQLSRIGDHPRALEERFLEERLLELERSLGGDHPLVQAALGGRSAEGAAAHLLSRSILASRDGTEEAVEAGTLSPDDPGVALGVAMLPVYGAYSTRFDALSAREAELAAELGRARFAVYGSDVPPDASRSPRITDGQVIPYEYNGTLAPVYTTFYGFYDRHFSNGQDSDWALPDRWLTPPAGLDLGTPLNFISTADTYGGNSGSPAVTPELAIVGLNFDRNIQGLSRDFIYLPQRGRNIMVDVRAIQEAMDKVYDADRIVQEFLTHRLFRTEAEADAAVGGGD